jgi:uncharacterized protein YlzI (FlbEa/FlbD family)
MTAIYDSKLLRLTRGGVHAPESGGTLYVAAQSVAAIEENPSGETTIHLVGGENIIVKQKASDIARELGGFTEPGAERKAAR